VFETTVNASEPSPSAVNGMTAVELAPVPGARTETRPAPTIATFEVNDDGSATTLKNSPVAAWVLVPAASSNVTVKVSSAAAALLEVAGVKVIDAGAPAVVNET
jgi:hypothetical protein